MKIAGPLHPPFSLFGCAKKRKRAVHGPKEKKRFYGGRRRAWGLVFRYACLCPRLGAGGGFGGCRIGVLLFPLPLPWRFLAAGMPDGSCLGRRTAACHLSPGAAFLSVDHLVGAAICCPVSGFSFLPSNAKKEQAPGLTNHKSLLNTPEGRFVGTFRLIASSIADLKEKCKTQNANF